MKRQLRIARSLNSYPHSRALAHIHVSQFPRFKQPSLGAVARLVMLFPLLGRFMGQKRGQA